MPITQTTATSSRIIKRGRQTLLRRSHYDTSRTVLANHVGELFFVSGTVQRISERDGHTYICLVDVNCCSYTESLKPESERRYINIDHIWSEMTSSLIPPVARRVSNIGKVIRYGKLDGSFNFAFRPLETHSYRMALQTLVSRLSQAMSESSAHAGIIMRECNHFVNELKQGYYLTPTTRKIRLNFGGHGQRAAMADLQRIQRRLLKYAKVGNIKAIDEYFSSLVRQAGRSTAGFTPA